MDLEYESDGRLQWSVLLCLYAARERTRCCYPICMHTNMHHTHAYTDYQTPVVGFLLLLLHYQYYFLTEAVNSPSVVQYESLFITSHKAPVLAGAFSWDGQLAAAGSADTTIKVCC